MPNSLSSKNNNAIDITKFICSLLVVMIHYNPFEHTASNSINDIFYLLTQRYIFLILVPFFFVCNGYYIFRKMNLENPDFGLLISRIKKYLFNILFGL